MKLRAQIIVDVDAPDYITAADHQRRLEKLFLDLKQDYEHAELEFKTRRGGIAPRSQAREQPVRRASGRLHAYDDL
jgi:hypothetical protein